MLHQAQLSSTIHQLSIIVMTMAGHATHQPITVVDSWLISISLSCMQLGFGRNLKVMFNHSMHKIFLPMHYTVLCVMHMGDGEGRHWLVRMEWRPARWTVCLPLLILPCTTKSRSSLLAPAHPGGSGKRAVKRLWCGGTQYHKNVKFTQVLYYSGHLD